MFMIVNNKVKHSDDLDQWLQVNRMNQEFVNVFLTLIFLPLLLLFPKGEGDVSWFALSTFAYKEEAAEAVMNLGMERVHLFYWIFLGLFFTHILLYLVLRKRWSLGFQAYLLGASGVILSLFFFLSMVLRLEDVTAQASVFEFWGLLVLFLLFLFNYFSLHRVLARKRRARNLS